MPISEARGGSAVVVGRALRSPIYIVKRRMVIHCACRGGRAGRAPVRRAGAMPVAMRRAGKRTARERTHFPRWIASCQTEPPVRSDEIGMPLTILSVTAHSELEQAELERDAIKHGGGQCGIAADGLVGEPAITSHRKPPDSIDYIAATRNSPTRFSLIDDRFAVWAFYLFCRFSMECHSISAKHLAQAAVNSPIACSIACSSVNLHISADSQFPP